MELKEKIYFMKINSLIAKGIKRGLVVPFDEEYYNELNKTIVSYIPVDLDIKYLKPKVRPGKCYDRSLKMFYAMNNSELVRGSLEYFRVQGDDEGINHGWVERDGYVYDPTFKLRFVKDYYYKIFKVTDVDKVTQKGYCDICEYNNYYFNKAKSTTRESLRHGTERFMLATVIPLLEGIAEGNEDFKRELAIYLKEINYNYDEIDNSIEKEIKKS